MGFGNANVPGPVAATVRNGLMSASDKRDLEALKGLVPFTLMERTASGNPATFVDGLAGDVRNLRVTLTPTQSGSGDPYPPGGGKNLLEITANSATVNGVTYTVDRDAAGNVLSVTANGTASALSVLDLTGTLNQTAGQNYIFSGNASRFVGNANVTLRMRKEVTGAQFISAENGTSIPAGTNMHSFCIAVADGVTMSNDKFYPMIRRASDTDPTFAPYSNVRPVSGVSSVTVTRPGKNLIPTIFGALNGISVSTDSAGNVIVNGTASGHGYDNLNAAASPLAVYGKIAPGSYTASVANALPEGVALSLINDRHDANPNSAERRLIAFNSGTGTSISFSVTQPANVVWWLWINAGTQLDNFTLNPQLEAGSVATAYEAYQERSVTVPLVDGNNAALTVYGGTLDVTTGQLLVTRAAADLGTLNWRRMSDGYFYATDLINVVKIPSSGSVPADALCSHCPVVSLSAAYYNNVRLGIAIQTAPSAGYVVIRDNSKAAYSAEDFAAALSGATLVYPLKTPVAYQLTPAQLSALAGYNSVYADCGTVAVTYRANPTLAYEELMNAILSAGAGI